MLGNARSQWTPLQATCMGLGSISVIFFLLLAVFVQGGVGATDVTGQDPNVILQRINLLDSCLALLTIFCLLGFGWEDGKKNKRREISALKEMALDVMKSVTELKVLEGRLATMHQTICQAVTLAEESRGNGPNIDEWDGPEHENSKITYEDATKHIVRVEDALRTYKSALREKNLTLKNIRRMLADSAITIEGASTAQIRPFVSILDQHPRVILDVIKGNLEFYTSHDLKFARKLLAHIDSEHKQT